MIERTDTNSAMEEHHLHTVAKETLEAHKVSSVFSYRYAFILGWEKHQEMLEIMHNDSQENKEE